MPFDPGIVLAGVLVGATVGSFLAVVALRWEQGRSAVWGRSCCDHCQRPLPIDRLVPIVSFLASHGRCAACGARIDRRHLLLECGGALVGGMALGLQPGMPGLAGAIFGWCLLLLAAIDLACFWLPDRLTVPLGLTGVAAGIVGVAPAWQERLVGVVTGYAALAAVRLGYRQVRRREGLGGGDPKLVAAIGGWLGWEPLPWVVLLASVGGVGWFAVRRWRHRAEWHDKLPFGVPLAVAAWMIWLASVSGVWENSSVLL